MITKLSKYLLPLFLIAVGCVYLSTLSPTVYLGDSGELTAAAFCLGIPHNSGYPLYSLLGKLFCLIPLGNIAFRANLMSACLAVATVWLIYSIILKSTGSRLAGFVGAGVLAFSRVFWLQTVSAEVYTLHAFFVALLVRVLLWWDEEKDFYPLALLVFLTGLSFGNHMQTVMLAPGVLWMVFSGDRKALLNVKRFGILTVLFVVALSAYLYLPIRTEAGAAIHWGDPSTLDRFIAHVSGRAHRESYVFTKTGWEYLIRSRDAVLSIDFQFGVMLFFSLWGWVRSAKRWKVFWVLVIAFDFFYTLFLNTISLQVTPFLSPTLIVLVILAGTGLAHGLARIETIWSKTGARIRILKAACWLIPFFALYFNYDLSAQSKNYTGYEWATNILRTAGRRTTLFMEGDNIFFPILYLRVAERSREDLRLYNRQNIVFKMPYLGESGRTFHGSWIDFRALLEKEIVERSKAEGVFYAVFEANTIRMPGKYQLVPRGLVYQVVEREKLKNPYKVENVWKYYGRQSFFDDFARDYLNREASAHFLLKLGEYCFMLGDKADGYKYLELASTIGYDDRGIHALIASSLAHESYFKEAREEVIMNARYQTDASAVQNTWGCYYYDMGVYNQAAVAFRKATHLRPKEALYHKNLAMALIKANEPGEAALHIQKSLELNRDQPDLTKVIDEYGLDDCPGD
jgi:tetratricopeptide (TPR) repeat protein